MEPLLIQELTTALSHLRIHHKRYEGEKEEEEEKKQMFRC